MDLLIAPHNDDEALFGAYTCLRYRPKVIVVLRSFIEESWTPPVHYETREAETAAACAVLGVEHEQWEFPDSAPDWIAIRERLDELDVEHVWAPLPEPGGHPHHNAIGAIAGALWPHTTYYATYTHARGKTTTGMLVSREDGWGEIKREAMNCYVSQATHPMCRVAFESWALDEYIS